MSLIGNIITGNPLLVFCLATTGMALTLYHLFDVYVLTPRSGKQHLLKRMLPAKTDKKPVTQKDILIQLRKERSANAGGILRIVRGYLRRLIRQAGLKANPKKLLSLWLGYVVLSGFVLFLLLPKPITLLFVLPVTAFILPLAWLNMKKTSNLKIFGTQLPEAIELITRSLKAGHPVPVALSMVAKQMPDPIGAEFRILMDEINHGADSVNALASLYERVGHPDLSLLVASVSIQMEIGGNLREILDGLARVIRERQKLKAKVHAISAEGRWSAAFLSALPMVFMTVLALLVPSFYQGIWDQSLTYYLFGGLLVWLLIGNVLILRMVNFKV